MAGEGNPAEARSASAAVDALEQEHRRLARDIHDGPAQVFTSLALHSEVVERLIGADDARAIAEVRELRREALAAADEIRQLLYQLVPPGLLRRELADVVAEHAKRLQSRYGLTVHSAIPSQLPIAKTVQATIFRVIQEALQNIARHSGAREAWVRVAPDSATPSEGSEAGALEVTIWDQGTGFDPDHPSVGDARHLGIAGMRERAALAGGSLTIQSQPGGGARVTLRLPLAR